MKIDRMLVGQYGYYGIPAQISLRLPKIPKEKVYYKIDLGDSLSGIYDFAQQIKDLKEKDINSIDFRYNKQDNYIIIDSNSKDVSLGDFIINSRS